MAALEVQNVHTRHQWAEIISADWRKSREGVVQTGRDLIAARAEIPDGEFTKMVKEDLPFSIRTAQRLINIAECPAIADAPTPARLPSGWTVLAYLASMNAEDFEDAQERGLINADITEGKARAISRAYKTPMGKVIGKGKSVLKLPSPKEARDVARATSRMVAASDGNLYSGSTEEEGVEYVRRREQTYAIIDAIKAISECSVSPKTWCDQVKDHWLVELEFGRITGAVFWLTAFRSELVRQKLVFDVEVKTGGE